MLKIETVSLQLLNEKNVCN